MRRVVALAWMVGVSCCVSACGDNGLVVQPDGGGGGEVDLAMPPMPMPLARFAVIGDFGVDTADEMAVARLVRGWHPDYVITVGDNNYPDGETATMDTNIGQYYSEFIGGYRGKYGPGSAHNRFWPVVGNHDWSPSSGTQPFAEYFPALPGNRRYYDVAIGNIHFFAVDSDPREPDGIDATSTQAMWLQSALAQSKECFNVVFFHHPPFSSGDPLFTEPQLRWPFAAWGADLVLTGHQHLYERLVVGGLPYVIDGLGGALNRFPFNPAPEVGLLVRYNDDFGALSVEVFDGKMSFTFENTHGTVVDRFDVTRDCGSAHTPYDAGM